MTEERITTAAPHESAPSTHTTIIREDGPSRGSGAGWLIAIVILLVGVAGIYIFSQTSASEAVKDNAIAGAAEEVGAAASQVGDAAEQAADAIAN